MSAIPPTANGNAAPSSNTGKSVTTKKPTLCDAQFVEVKAAETMMARATRPNVISLYGLRNFVLQHRDPSPLRVSNFQGTAQCGVARYSYGLAYHTAWNTLGGLTILLLT